MNIIEKSVPNGTKENRVNFYLANWGLGYIFVLRNELNLLPKCRVLKSSKTRRGYCCKVDLVRFATSQIPAPLHLFSSFLKVAKPMKNTQADYLRQLKELSRQALLESERQLQISTKALHLTRELRNQYEMGLPTRSGVGIACDLLTFKERGCYVN